MNGYQTITVTDTLTGSIVGTVTLAVTSNPATHFAVSGSASTVAGNPMLIEVTALDSLGNIALGYAGTVHFTSTDAQAFIPADATLTGGIGFFAAALRTAGSDTLTAMDTTNPNIAGSATIDVSAAAANHFVLSGPTTVVTGMAFAFTVTAKDSYSNTALNYHGTVQISSSDTSSTLPLSNTLTGGIGVFTVTLKSGGSQTLTATDVANTTITGTSNSIATRGLTVASLTPTPTGFVATFDKPFDPSQINLYDANGNWGPDDVLLTGPGARRFPSTARSSSIPATRRSPLSKPASHRPQFNPATGVLTARRHLHRHPAQRHNGFKD